MKKVYKRTNSNKKLGPIEKTCLYFGKENREKRSKRRKKVLLKLNHYSPIHHQQKDRDESLPMSP